MTIRSRKRARRYFPRRRKKPNRACCDAIRNSQSRRRSSSTLLAGWWLACHVLGAPAYVVPAPEDVGRALINGFSRAPWDTGGYWFHAGVTVWEALLGFVIGSAAGAVLGFALCHWPLLGRSWYPYIVGFQSLPKVALAPLMVVWFGFGLEGKVFITAVITFFPVLVNTMAGINRSSPTGLSSRVRAMPANGIC